MMKPQPVPVQKAAPAPIEKHFDRAIPLDGLCAALLASALACVGLALFGQETPAWICLAYTVVSTTLLILCMRRWWVAPLVIGLAGLTAVIWCAAAGWDNSLIYLAEAGDWIADGMKEDAQFEALRHLLMMLATLPVSALAYFFARRCFSFLVYTVLSAGVVVFMYVMKMEQDVPMLSFLLLGGLLSLPRVASKNNLRLHRRAVQLIALPMAVVCVVLAVAITPAKDGEWYSDAVVTVVEDIRDLYRLLADEEADADGRNTLNEMLQPLESRLGGDVELTDDPVLRVAGNARTLLTASVMDAYNGECWYDGWDNHRFRFNSLLWRIRRNRSFGLNLPSGTQARALAAEMTIPLEYRVNVAKDTGNTIFSAGQMRAVELFRANKAYFNNQNEVYAANRIAVHTSYRFNTTVWDRTLPNFTQNLLELEQMTIDRRDNAYAGIVSGNTYLFDNLPATVREQAQSIVTEADAQTPVQKALAIEQWLADNCTYTLTPGDPPENTDFVAHFLETRQGYCTYYASAMAVLARCEGLPARYVIGYSLTPDTAGEGLYTARALNAHAWAEIYFNGIGWIPFDPLRYALDDLIEQQLAMPEEPVILQEIEPTPTQPPMLPQNDEAAVAELVTELSTPKVEFSPWMLAPVLAVLLFFVLRALLVWLFKRPLRLYSLSALQRRYFTRAPIVTLYYSDLLRQLKLFGIQPQNGETLKAFLQRADEGLTLENEIQLSTCNEALYRVLYGLKEPSPAETDEVYRVHEALEKALREAMPAMEYLLKRCLHKPK